MDSYRCAKLHDSNEVLLLVRPFLRLTLLQGGTSIEERRELSLGSVEVSMSSYALPLSGPIEVKEY